MARTIPQVVATLKKGGKGGVLTSKQLNARITTLFREIEAAIKDFIVELVESTGRHPLRRDTSGFFGKLRVDVTQDGSRIQLPDYAVNIDEGRKPGATMIPLDVLIKWLKRYRIQGRQKRTGRFRSASGESINAAAKAIQRSIYNHGIKARPFIQAALDYQQVLIASIVDEIIIPDIASIVELTLSNKK